jgi:cation:H+ antiporter
VEALFGSLTAATVVVIGSAAVIVLAGPRMVGLADRLADVTGLGEALVGAVLVGAATSLPDTVATITPAPRGLPDLAVGSALGGVLAQAAFLAVADITYRRANLEHAAASLANIMQGTLLVLLLGTVMILFQAPQVTVAGVHPGTLVLLVMYGYGLRVTAEGPNQPMWRAVATRETRQDVPQEPPRGHAVPRLVLGFAGLAVVLGFAGWALARAGETIAAATGLSQTAVGVLLTGLSSSLAELVVSIAAIRAGALTLAVANVIGGNTFDTLLVTLLVGVADIAYREGSVYGAVGPDQTVMAGIALVATTVIVLGLLRRERHGLGNIGVESAVVLVLYAGAAALVL